MKIQPFKMTVTNEKSQHVQQVLAGFGITWRGMKVHEYQNIGADHHLMFDGVCLTWSFIDLRSFTEYDLPELSYHKFIEITSTVSQHVDIIERYLMMNEPDVYKRTKRSNIKDWLVLTSNI